MSIIAKEGDTGMYHSKDSDSLAPAVVQQVGKGNLVDLLVGNPDEDKFEAVSIQVVEGAVETRKGQRYFVLGEASLPVSDPNDADTPTVDGSESEDDIPF